MSARFVWLRGLRGPEPQLWFEPLVGCAYLKDRVLAEHRLPLLNGRAAGTLDDLARLYPAPPMEDCRDVSEAS